MLSKETPVTWIVYKINEILALIDYCMDLENLRGRAKWANVLHVTPLYLFLETWVGTFCEIKDMLWGTHAMLQLSTYVCTWATLTFIVFKKSILQNLNLIPISSFIDCKQLS